MTREIESYIATLTVKDQKSAFDILHEKFHIHPLEKEWNIHAGFILEAIARSQDITKRGVRGIIAELAFSTNILGPLKPTWTEINIIGDQPYDSLIRDRDGEIKIQTKNQRLVQGEPLFASGAYTKIYPALTGWFVAETQKTRSGKPKKKKITKSEIVDTEESELVEVQSTRPYRFGEFDILSVCLHPSTRSWSTFMFTPASTLFKKKYDDQLIATLQPVPPDKQFAWTNDLLECIEWVRHPETMPSVPVPKIVANKALLKKKTASKS